MCDVSKCNCAIQKYCDRFKQDKAYLVRSTQTAYIEYNGSIADGQLSSSVKGLPSFSLKILRHNKWQ